MARKKTKGSVTGTPKVPEATAPVADPVTAAVTKSVAKAKKAPAKKIKKVAKRSPKTTLDPVALAVAVAQALKAAQPDSSSSQAELVKALAEAITLTKPKEKKTAVTRKPGDPWQPKDGSPKLKLKRKIFQHGLPVDPDMSTNEEIALMNELRPGRFCDGWIKVYRRRDKGIDIDYPIKTAAQRLKLPSLFGINSFQGLLERCIAEAKDPKKYKTAEEIEDLD